MVFYLGYYQIFSFVCLKLFTEFQIFTVLETLLNKNYLIVYNALDKTISFKSSKSYEKSFLTTFSHKHQTVINAQVMMPRVLSCSNRRVLSYMANLLGCIERNQNKNQDQFKNCYWPCEAQKRSCISR